MPSVRCLRIVSQTGHTFRSSGSVVSMDRNILDPDAFIFGGGVSNEIDFLSEIESMVKKFVIGKEYQGVFLKPKFGDASGVIGAAHLGRNSAK